MGKNRLNIWYVDFWQPFDYRNPKNYFTRLLAQAYEVEVTPQHPDLLFYSVFGCEHRKWNHPRKIFFTGENRSPDSDYSLAFSFDYEENDRCLRLPLYAVAVYEEETMDRLLHKQATPRENFCSFMVSNLHQGFGARHRVDFFNKLHACRKVMSSGRSLRNVDYSHLGDAHGVDDWRRWKGAILERQKPKFMITFENERQSGYTTEKITDAMVHGILPIYWGNPEIARDFNRNSIVWADDFPNLDELTEYVLFLDRDEEAYRDLWQQPWLKSEENLHYFRHDRILTKIQELLENKKIYSLQPTRHPLS